jgi:integrase/recombinase XerD
MAERSPLRRRIIEDMTVRNLSSATQRSYVHGCCQVRPVFCGRSPDKLDPGVRILRQAVQAF